MERASLSCQEVVKVSSGTSQESLVSRAAGEFTPDLVEPFPQLCSEANDFFKVRHLGAHWFLNGYRKYNFEKAETSLGGRDRR